MQWKVEQFVNSPSTEEFKQLVQAQNFPMVIQNFVREWEAFEKWNPCSTGLTYLKDIAGAATVQAMVSTTGSMFNGDIRSHERVCMLFAEFIDSVTKLLREDRKEDGDDSQMYLAQVPIYMKSSEAAPLSSLQRDISTPEFLDADAISNINLWMSSRISKSSIHYDPYHNMLCVVAGSKKVTLWPPTAAPFLYPLPIYGEASNHSEVNFVQPDYKRFTRFKEAENYAKVVVVKAGDGIFIPEGWYHQVDSDAATIAVNFWWPSAVSLAFNTHMDPYFLRRILVSLLDSEKDTLLQSSAAAIEETDLLSDETEDLNLEDLTPSEAIILQNILAFVATRIECSDPEDYDSDAEDPFVDFLRSSNAITFRRIIQVMVDKFPRSLEALVLHGLCPLAAEMLTKKWEELERFSSEFKQQEFYRTFYSVFDHPQLAMEALLVKKERFAEKAWKNVMLKFINN